jgi:hypothetical protein
MIDTLCTCVFTEKIAFVNYFGAMAGHRADGKIFYNLVYNKVFFILYI